MESFVNGLRLIEIAVGLIIRPAQQNYTAMEKLLKLVQTRSNSFDYERNNVAIFDIQTYQKAIDRISCSSSLNQLTPQNKRFSFSEGQHKHQSPHHNHHQIAIKQEIRPHETKQIASRIAEIIRSKRDGSKFLQGEGGSKEKVMHSQGPDKKSSYSAYINARKKIFEKQSSNVISHSTSAFCDRKDSQLKGAIQAANEEEKERNIFFPEYLNQLQEEPSQRDKVASYMNVTLSKYHRVRLEGLVTNKKIQLQKKQASHSELQERTSNLRKGFITVIKRRHEANLMVKPGKRFTSQKKVEAEQPVLDYVRNFAGHKNLQEDDIQLFPKVESILKFTRAAENQYSIGEVNSRSVTILHHINGETKSIYSLNDKERLEIASITKTMTCFLVLTIADKFGLDVRKEKAIVSERAAKMPGTSAKLAYSDVLSVYDLLHGLMLPSGNDAAIALGEWGGKQIKKYSGLLRRMRVGESECERTTFLQSFMVKRKSYLRLFVHHMNRLAKHLHLNSTHFVNTHGLMNEKAYSCSQNIALLTHYCMANRTFREIVGRQDYHCRAFNRTFSHAKDIAWENTNKLLQIEGFQGVKTGITPSAGPCLTSLFAVSATEHLIITILKTKSCEMRFKETINLLKATLAHFLAKQPAQAQYQRAIRNLEQYDRLDLKSDQKEQLNTCRESTQSNQSNEQLDEDFDLKYS